MLDFRLDVLEVGGRVLARNVSLHVEGPQKLCIIGRHMDKDDIVAKLDACLTDYVPEDDYPEDGE